MVELQRTFSDRSDDVAVYAISYDPVDTLTRFAATHGITYPLLADEGSAVIEELGILNTTLEQERAAYGRPIEERHRGIPYPGSFFLDESGVVTGKRFEQSHRIRPTANTLLQQLSGAEAEPAAAADGSSPGVRFAAWLDTDVLYANQLQEVHVRFDVDPGVHLYTEPVPDGFRALAVTVGGDDRLHAEVAMPEKGESFGVAGLDEEFHVVEGQIDLSVPFFLLSNRDTAGDEARPVPLTVEVAYQACTDDECFMPERQVLQLDLTEEPNPGYETTDLAALSPLVMRRIVEGPKSVDDLMALVNAALTGTSATEEQVKEALEALAGRDLIVEGSDGRWQQA